MKWILCLLTLPLFAANWSLTDPDAGWNQNELVRLYFHNSELQRQWAWSTLSHYQFRGDERVLDLGSGDGKITAMISYMVREGEIQGVDFSAQMVEFSSRMFPPSHFPNLSFIRSTDGNFEGDNFDLVTSFCVFHLVPNPVETLSSIRKKMKPDGRLILAIPITGDPDFVAVLTDEFAARDWQLPPPTTDTIRMCDPDRIPDVLNEAGFEIDHLEIVDACNAYSCEEELIDWLEGTLSANWNIPPEHRREFFTTFLKRYLERRPSQRDEAGFVYLGYTHAEVLAHPMGRG